MKRIVIAGGTGFIGKHLSKHLAMNGYEVVILTRNPPKSNEIDSITYEKLEINNIENTAKVINDAFAVINLSGAGIGDKRWTPEYKKIIHDSRVSVTSHLIKVLNFVEKKPKSFISASAIGIYGDRGDEMLNEKSGLSSTFLAKVCHDWEKEADNCPQDIRLIKARMGIILSIDGGALPKMITPFKFFIGGPIGSGNQWMSWIHIDDICNMFLMVIENEESRGVINFVVPNPVQMNEFAETLGKMLGRPSFFRLPAFVLKIILGESSVLVLESQRVNSTAAEHLDYKFKFKTLSDALKNLLS